METLICQLIFGQGTGVLIKEGCTSRMVTADIYICSSSSTSSTSVTSHMEPANRTRDAAWPLCGRNHQPLGRRARIRPRSIKRQRSQSTPVREPGFLQQLETLQGAVGKLSQSLENSAVETVTAPPTPLTSLPVTVADDKQIDISIIESSHLDDSTSPPKSSMPFPSSYDITSIANHSVQHTGALWEHYLDKVDPLLKIIDTSAVQHLFISAMSPDDVPKDVRSLKSAILFAAASSMQRPFGSTCPISDALMKTHAREVEDYLAASRFMAQPSIVALQALTIYLTCGSRFLEQTYVWSLTAILVRLAMALKLHRDPESQGLPFSDCEYRRRLWWHVCALDAQTSEANHTDPIIHERQCTTRVPEWSTDPACPGYLKNMFFSAVRSEITYYSRTILFSDQFTIDNGYPVLPSDGKLCIIDALEDTLQEKYFRCCDCNLSTFRLALISSKITIARLKLAVLYPQTPSISSIPSEDVDRILRACVSVMEGLRSFRADPSLSLWAWYWQSHADWDAAETCLTVLAQQQTHTASSEVISRAWSATEAFFDSWTESVLEPSRQKHWKRLNQLRSQAKLPHAFRTKKNKKKKNKSHSSKSPILTPQQTHTHASDRLHIQAPPPPPSPPPMLDISRRSMTAPLDSNTGGKLHRKSLLQGVGRNWSLPIYPRADEMYFEIQALEL